MSTNTIKTKTIKESKIRLNFTKNWQVYLMGLPVILYYLIFKYYPMYGAIIAFQDYTPGSGFLSSEWVGFKHFHDFILSPDFLSLIRNTLSISLVNLAFGFTAPIIFALLINEINGKYFKKTVQTITYLPHFISIVVICGIIKSFVGFNGIISGALSPFIGDNVDMLNNAKMFLPIYVISDIWQGMGWSSIIYIAAMAGIDSQLYEAAQIDGAGKLKQIIHITLPGLSQTIIVLFLMRVGNLLSVGYEKIILLYNPLTYSRADVISSYVYRVAFEGQQWSYTTAIGLFNSIVNFGLLFIANTMSKKMTDSSLW